MAEEPSPPPKKDYYVEQVSTLTVGPVAATTPAGTYPYLESVNVSSIPVGIVGSSSVNDYLTSVVSFAQAIEGRFRALEARLKLLEDRVG